MLRFTDEGALPVMRIWSILLIEFDLKWCIHLSRSLFLYFYSLKEQDKSSDIEQQPPLDDRKISNIQPQNGGGGLQNQQEHHIILTKFEAVHPTAVSENNSSAGMLII